MIIHSSKMKNVCLSLLAICLSSATCFANDVEIKRAYDKAFNLFQSRSRTDSTLIDQALLTLSEVEGKAEDSDLNYDIYILESRCLYWKGSHQASNDDKMFTHDLGVQKAEKAKSIDDGYAEAYYFAGINLARWGEAKGILASLSRKGELESYMQQTLAHRTRGDQPGKMIDGFGPDRVFGRMFYKLPGLFGGSLEKSLMHLRTAYLGAKNIPLNIIYYAESLSSGTREQKAMAIKLLDELLKSNPLTYNPERLPENLDEFELARKLRNELG